VKTDTQTPRAWPPDAAGGVAALYEAHATGFIRLAVVMLGDRSAAEDVVHDAYCGLYRRWQHLDDPGKALRYLRSAVLNGCRNQLRARSRAHRRSPDVATHAQVSAASAEEDVLLAEEHREVLAALRGLPARQREALVLRFYLGLAEPDIAAAMGVSAGTVKSTTSRALAALGRLLQEDR
jgi:RNA polymerase sigma-70 factor (sigma-E family)